MTPIYRAGDRAVGKRSFWSKLCPDGSRGVIIRFPNRWWNLTGYNVDSRWTRSVYDSDHPAKSSGPPKLGVRNHVFMRGT